MSSLKKRMAQLAKSAPQEYDVDAADTFDDGTRAVDAAGRAVLDEDMQLGAPQFRADIDMGDDPRYAGVATSRKALRRQRGEESEDEVDEDGSESSDEDMGVEIDEVSEASSDEEPGTTTQSRVETEDIEAELEALEKSDQQVLMKKSNAANAAEQAAHTRNQIVRVRCSCLLCVHAATSCVSLSLLVLCCAMYGVRHTHCRSYGNARWRSAFECRNRS